MDLINQIYLICGMNAVLINGKVYSYEAEKG